jgi:hypothetical protein
MFVSTFQRTHWLVPGYLLGQTWRRMSMWMMSTLTHPRPRGVSQLVDLCSWSQPPVPFVELPPHPINSQASLWRLTLCYCISLIASPPHCCIPLPWCWQSCTKHLSHSDSALCNNIMLYWFSVSRESISYSWDWYDLRVPLWIILRKGPGRPWYQSQADCRKP